MTEKAYTSEIKQARYRIEQAQGSVREANTRAETASERADRASNWLIKGALRISAGRRNRQLQAREADLKKLLGN